MTLTNSFVWDPRSEELVRPWLLALPPVWKDWKVEMFLNYLSHVNSFCFFEALGTLTWIFFETGKCGFRESFSVGCGFEKWMMISSSCAQFKLKVYRNNFGFVEKLFLKENLLANIFTSFFLTFAFYVFCCWSFYFFHVSSYWKA